MQGRDREGNEAGQMELWRLRGRIDEVDRRLVSLIAKRCRLASAAGRKKLDEGRGLCDPDREELVLGRAVGRARAAGLHEERIRRLFAELISLSLWVQSHGGPGSPAAASGGEE
jgi:chorismate mutase